MEDVLTDKYSLLFGNCLERMKEIPSGSVDLILTDPPYGTTACKWDSVIPFEPMWDELKRIIKPNGAVVLFGSEPFSSALRMSNIKQYKYDWVWEKNTCTGFMQAKTKPLKSHENILVFGDFRVAAQYFKGTYIPTGVKAIGEVTYSNKRCEDHITGNRNPSTTNAGKGYPKDIIRFNSEQKTVHPTQKPVPLLEYLIKTYTQEGETVLDFTMGSGSTIVAALNTNRKSIGIEMDEGYFDIASKRVAEVINKEKDCE